jgi:hypothetical protein
MLRSAASKITSCHSEAFATAVAMHRPVSVLLVNTPCFCRIPPATDRSGRSASSPRRLASIVVIETPHDADRLRTPWRLYQRHQLVEHLALVLTAALSGCTTFKPPQISYDDELPPPAELPKAADDHPRPLHVPPAWTPARGGNKGDAAAMDPTDRIETANRVARVQPRRAGYFNAVQVFPYSPGALYQIYASPGQMTDIALEPGEQLTGSGPLAAGDTVRWIVGDTESGNGDTKRVHIMVEPTRAAIENNLVVNTDRRTYLIELRAREKPYMPSVSWSYPENRINQNTLLPTPLIPDMSQSSADIVT